MRLLRTMAYAPAVGIYTSILSFIFGIVLELFGIIRYVGGFDCFSYLSSLPDAQSRAAIVALLLLAHRPLGERTGVTARQLSRKPGLVGLIFLQEAGANAELPQLGADRYLAHEGHYISPF